MVAQLEHQAVFAKHVKELGGDIELGVAFASLKQTSDDVEVELIKVVNGEDVKEVSKYKWVIGTDGAKSAEIL